MAKTPVWVQAIPAAKSEMTFCFGQVAVEFLGDDQLIGFFRNIWKRYLEISGNTQSETVLIFEKAPSLTDEHFGDGWNEFLLCGEKAIAYSQNGKMLFALQNSASGNQTKIMVYDDEKRIIRLAAQYGLMYTLHQKCIGLHGVTLLCGNEVVILSAPSGTGKTTLAKLLEKYCDAIVINGDFALLNPTEKGIIFEPTPFCGTSGRDLNHRFKVNRVVFLSQAKDNSWHELSGREALMQFMDNAFIPTWDEDMRRVVCENVVKCILGVKVCTYAFAPTQEAAEVFCRHLADKDKP